VEKQEKQESLYGLRPSVKVYALGDRANLHRWQEGLCL
jgi:hypothetical protein